VNAVMSPVKRRCDSPTTCGRLQNCGNDGRASATSAARRALRGQARRRACAVIANIGTLAVVATRHHATAEHARIRSAERAGNRVPGCHVSRTEQTGSAPTIGVQPRARTQRCRHVKRTDPTGRVRPRSAGWVCERSRRAPVVPQSLCFSFFFFFPSLPPFLFAVFLRECGQLASVEMGLRNTPAGGPAPYRPVRAPVRFDVPLTRWCSSGARTLRLSARPGAAFGPGHHGNRGTRSAGAFSDRIRRVLRSGVMTGRDDAERRRLLR